jgi:hypothetical protein
VGTLSASATITVIAAPPPPPPPNRTAVVSYDRMAPRAPYWGQSPYGFQSFTAQSNTLTYVGVTWGSGNYQPGSSVAGVTARIRVCSLPTWPPRL